MDTVRRRQVAHFVAIALACLAFAALLAERGARWWVFTLDDAYITLRYSRHWAEGLGPSWNPGGPPAEGYTTTLWMALLALAVRLGLDGLLFAKLAGGVFALATLGFASHMAWRLSGKRTLAACVPWLFGCAYWPLALHAVSGMETTCSAFILTLFFWLSSELTPRRYPALSIAALLACLARPEAVLACGATLALLLWRERLPLLRAVALYTVLPGLLYFLLRYHHFGLLFPLSFYVKATGRESFAGLSDVLEFYAVFAVARPWWGALCVLGAWRDPRLTPALVGALAFSVFFIFPEHIMAFESRYMIPLFPLLSTLAGLGACKLVDRLATRFALPIVTALVLLAGALPTSALSNVEPWLDYGRGLQRAHVTFAHAMRDSGVREGRIAMLDVGAVGYLADWDTLDTFGLNDAHVALTHRQDVDYVFATRPDLLVLVSRVPRVFEAFFPWEEALYPAAMQRGYRYLCDYQFDPHYYLQVLARDENRSRDEVLCRAATHP